MTDNELEELALDVIEEENDDTESGYYCGCNHFPLGNDGSIAVSMHNCDACYYETPTQFSLCPNKKKMPVWRRLAN